MDISKATCPNCRRLMEIRRVTCPRDGLSMEGEFELPSLARLSTENQVFVMSFIRSHGSLKRMEEIFGISYPTVKNRLNTIAAELQDSFTVPSSAGMAVLEELERGEIDMEEALRRLG